MRSFFKRKLLPQLLFLLVMNFSVMGQVEQTESAYFNLEDLQIEVGAIFLTDSIHFRPGTSQIIAPKKQLVRIADFLMTHPRLFTEITVLSGDSISSEKEVALGQNRAMALSNYFVNSGVAKARVMPSSEKRSMPGNEVPLHTNALVQIRVIKVWRE